MFIILFVKKIMQISKGSPHPHPPTPPKKNKRRRKFDSNVGVWGWVVPKSLLLWHILPLFAEILLMASLSTSLVCDLFLRIPCLKC